MPRFHRFPLDPNEGIEYNTPTSVALKKIAARLSGVIPKIARKADALVHHFG